MADATNSGNKELAWSFTMDDSQFEASMKKNGIIIKDFDALLKKTTSTIKTMQKSLANTKMPKNTIKATEIVTSESNKNIKIAEQSIDDLKDRAEVLSYVLDNMTIAEKKANAEAAKMVVEYGAVQKAIKDFEEVAAKGGKTIKQISTEQLQKQFRELGINVASFNREQLESIRITRNQEKVLNSNEDSYNRQNAQLTLNRKILKGLNKEQASAANIGGKLRKEIERQDKALKAFDDTMGITTRKVGSYEKAMRKVVSSTKLAGSGSKLSFGNMSSSMGTLAKGAGALAAGFFGAQGIIAGLKMMVNLAGKAVETMGEFSDVMANVQKVTGQTDESFSKMNDTLKKIDTRTALNQLLAIVESGGKFQVPEEDLAQFAENVNTVIVGLESDLEGGASEITLSLAKINSAFTTLKSKNIAEGVKFIGSAINELAQKSTAQAQPILEYTKRMTALTKSLKLAPAEVLALAATFDQAAVSAEVSATATNTLLLHMSKDTVAAAKIAKVAVEDFSEMINTEPIKALNLFAKGLTGTGSNLETISADLKDFGLSGARAASTILALGKNQEAYAKNVKIASDELKSGNSITKEAAGLNKTLQAELDKLSNMWDSAFANPETTREMAEFIKMLRIDLVPVIRDLVPFLFSLSKVIGSTLGFAFKTLGMAIEGVYQWFDLLTGIRLDKLFTDVQNLNTATKNLQWSAKAVRFVFDILADGDPSAEVEKSAEALKKAKKSLDDLAKSKGFKDAEEMKKHMRELSDETKKTAKTLDDASNLFGNVKFPEISVITKDSDIAKMQLEITKLKNAKIEVVKATNELMALPVTTHIKMGILEGESKQDQIDEAIKAGTKAILKYQNEQLELALTEKQQKEINALVQSLKSQEELKKEQYKKDLLLLEEAQQKGLEIEGGYVNAKKAIIDDYNKYASQKAEEFAAKEEEERLKTVNRFATVGQTKLEALTNQYAEELNALRIAEMSKVDIERDYNEVRLLLRQEYAEKASAIEEADKQAELDKLKKDNELLLEATEFGIGQLSDVVSQFAIDGKSTEDVLKGVGKAVLKWALGMITAKLMVAASDSIIEKAALAGSIAAATPASAALTKIWLPSATLASIASFGGAAVAGGAAMTTTLGAMGALFGGSTSTATGGISGAGSMSFGQFTNTGGLNGGAKNASGPTTGDLLGQMQANAYNAETTGITPINVNITSSDPNTEVSISYAKGQNSLVSSGYNVEEID